MKSAELDQGVYRVKAAVTNANTFPLESFTVKWTFMNGEQVVGEPEYGNFHSGSFFSSRVMDPKSSTTLESSGEPPAEWTGQGLRAEITAYEIDD